MEQDALEELLLRLRRAADEELMTRFNRVGARFKTDGSLVTEADLAMQGRMQRELAGLFPDYGFLGEEMELGQRQSRMDRTGAGIWVLDPLDGTSNYVAGIPYFAVSLALVIERRVALAVVYDPARQELFHALAGQGALLNGAPLARRAAPAALRKAIAVVDYKRLPAELARVSGGNAALWIPAQLRLGGAGFLLDRRRAWPCLPAWQAQSLGLCRRSDHPPRGRRPCDHSGRLAGAGARPAAALHGGGARCGIVR